MVTIPANLKKNTVIWTGWNIQDIYDLIPHRGIEHFYKIEIEKAVFGYNLVIYGPNITDIEPIKFVARMGDAVCYDSGLDGGVRIITDEHRTTPEFLGYDTDTFNNEMLIEAYNKVKDNMVEFLGLTTLQKRQK